MIVAYKGGVNYMDTFGTTAICPLFTDILMIETLQSQPTKSQERGATQAGMLKTTCRYDRMGYII